MQKKSRTGLDSDRWTTIREFTDGDVGCTFPKYEAKFVEDVEKRYVENEIVLVKKIDSVTGGETIYQLPRSVFEEVVDRIQ